MKFQIPFTKYDTEVLKRKSKYFLKFTTKKETTLDKNLRNTGVDIDKRNYLAICYRNFVYNFTTMFIIFTLVFGVLSFLQIIGVYVFLPYGAGLAFIIAGFVLFNQYNYPRIFSLNKTRDIEKNLVAVLQDMMVQLNSGVPLFRIMLNISNSNYGEVSEEFKKIVAEINAGVSQIQAIEKYGKTNTSEYFRRVLWQMSNGMRAGSDMSIVIAEEIKNLGKEQAIQIQSYGSKLNPLIMFYMLIAVIIPALGITFIIILSSMVGIESTTAQFALVVLFIGVVFIQIMFMGVIKSRRPSLL